MANKNKPPLNLTAQILVAMPQMQDPRFREAVIFICGHDKHGAMGLVLNKIVDSISFKDLLQQLKISTGHLTADVPIHYGGPLEIGRGFVLHTTDYMNKATVRINDYVALTATAEVLEVIASGAGPRRYLLALGYAGWSPGQLESEVQTNSWLEVPFNEELIFSETIDMCWKKALSLLGIDPEMLTSGAGHA